jgi:hypothetical protein
MQHTRQKLVNSLQLEMNRGKLRERLEANEISERAQQEEFAIGMEEMKIMSMALRCCHCQNKAKSDEKCTYCT